MPPVWSLPTAFSLNAALTALLMVILPRKLRDAGLVRTNFVGQPVVTACGVILVAGSLPGFVLLASAWHATRPYAGLLVMLLIGFGALGFADDRWGSPAAKGLRGHLRKLIRERTVTSGLVKAVGGILVALAAVAVSFPCDPFRLVVSSAIIALSANAVNLLDLRPGRASATAMIVLAVCMAALWGRGSPEGLACVGCLIVPAIMLYVPDARARLMLGDAGSNALGAGVGAALVFALPTDAGRYWALAMLALLHVIAERWSLSAIIAANPVLRTLDRWTGVRG